jgi:hypothetical protein
VIQWGLPRLRMPFDREEEQPSLIEQYERWRAEQTNLMLPEPDIPQRRAAMVEPPAPEPMIPEPLREPGPRIDMPRAMTEPFVKPPDMGLSHLEATVAPQTRPSLLDEYERWKAEGQPSLKPEPLIPEPQRMPQSFPEPGMGQPVQQQPGRQPGPIRRLLDSPDITWLDKAVNAVASFYKSTVSELPASVMEAAALYQTKLGEALGLIERGQPVSDRTLFQQGQNLRQWAERSFPGNKALQDDFLWTFMPSALGSFQSYIALGGGSGAAIGALARGAGLAARGAGIAQQVGQMGASAVAAGMSGAAQMYTDAIQHGASEEVARQAAMWGHGPGVLQVFPVMRALSRYKPDLMRPLADRLVNAVKQGAMGAMEEAIVESLGQVGYNKIAQDLYDEDRSLGEGVAVAGGAGAGAGFLASFALSMLGAPVRGQMGRVNPYGALGVKPGAAEAEIEAVYTERRESVLAADPKIQFADTRTIVDNLDAAREHLLGNRWLAELVRAEREGNAQEIQTLQDRLASIGWGYEADADAGAGAAPEVSIVRESRASYGELANQAHLAVHRYWSPRQKTLTADEVRVRDIAYRLADGDPAAARLAAKDMAPLVRPGDILVPVPSSRGQTAANRALAEAIQEQAQKSGVEVQVADLLVGIGYESQRERAVRGARRASADEIVQSLFLRDQAVDTPGELVLVDNVRTTGATIEAARMALPRPARSLVWAKAETFVDHGYLGGQDVVGQAQPLGEGDLPRARLALWRALRPVDPDWRTVATEMESAFSGMDADVEAVLTRFPGEYQTPAVREALTRVHDALRVAPAAPELSGMVAEGRAEYGEKAPPQGATLYHGTGFGSDAPLSTSAVRDAEQYPGVAIWATESQDWASENYAYRGMALGKDIPEKKAYRAYEIIKKLNKLGPEDGAVAAALRDRLEEMAPGKAPNVRPVALDIKNAFDLDAMLPDSEVARLLDLAHEMHPGAIRGRFSQKPDSNKGGDVLSVIVNMRPEGTISSPALGREKARSVLEAAGYDGFTLMDEGLESIGVPPARTWGAFYDEQVRPAIGAQESRVAEGRAEYEQETPGVMEQRATDVVRRDMPEVGTHVGPGDAVPVPGGGAGFARIDLKRALMKVDAEDAGWIADEMAGFFEDPYVTVDQVLDEFSDTYATPEVIAALNALRAGMKKPSEILPPGQLTLYRGGRQGEGEWFTPDREAATEYASLDEGLGIEEVVADLSQMKIAEPGDIIAAAEAVGVDPNSESLYALVGIEFPEVVSELQRRGFDAIHLPLGEDFAPNGKAIESYRLLDREGISEVVDFQPWEDWFDTHPAEVVTVEHNPGAVAKPAPLEHHKATFGTTKDVAAAKKAARSYVHELYPEERAKRLDKQRTHVDITGHVIRQGQSQMAEDVYKLLAPFRDGRMEIHHTLALDAETGEVVWHLYESSGAVDYVGLGIDAEKRIADMVKRTDRPVTLLFAHNHPTGEVTPSTNDLDVIIGQTAALADNDVWVLGGMVIDHNQATLYRVPNLNPRRKAQLGQFPLRNDVEQRRFDFDPAVTQAESPWLEGAAEQLVVRGPDRVATLVAQTTPLAPDQTAVLWIDSSGRTVALESVSADRAAAVAEWFEARRFEMGAAIGIFVSGHEAQTTAGLLHHQITGHGIANVQDIVLLTASGRVAQSFAEEAMSHRITPLPREKFDVQAELLGLSGAERIAGRALDTPGLWQRGEVGRDAGRVRPAAEARVREERAPYAPEEEGVTPPIQPEPAKLTITAAQARVTGLDTQTIYDSRAQLEQAVAGVEALLADATDKDAKIINRVLGKMQPLLDAMPADVAAMEGEPVAPPMVDPKAPPAKREIQRLDSNMTRMRDLHQRLGSKKMMPATDQVRDEVGALLEGALSPTQVQRVLDGISNAKTRLAAAREVSQAIRLVDKQLRKWAIADFEKTLKQAVQADMRPEFIGPVALAVEDIDLTNMSKKTQKVLRNTAKFLRDEVSAEHRYFPTEVMEALHEPTRQKMANMPIADLLGMTEAVQMAIHLNRDKNTMIGARRGQARDDLEAMFLKEVEAVPELKRGKVRGLETKPERSMIRSIMHFGTIQSVMMENLSPTLAAVGYDDLTIKAHNVALRFQHEARDTLFAAIESAGFNMRDGWRNLWKGRREFEAWRNEPLQLLTEDGEVQISRNEAIWMLTSIKDPTNLDIMRRGGVTIKRSDRRFAVTDEVLDNLRAITGESEAAIADALFVLFNGEMRDFANRHWVETYGFEIANEPNFVPRDIDMSSSKKYSDPLEFLADMRAATLTSWGHWRARKDRVTAPLEIGDAFNIFENHLSHISGTAYMPAVQNAVSLLGRPAVEKAIKARIGETAYQDMLNSIRLQSVKQSDPSALARGFRMRLRMFGAATLGLRLSPILLNPSGITVAASYQEHGFTNMAEAAVMALDPAQHARISEMLHRVNPAYRERYESFVYQATSGMATQVNTSYGRPTLADIALTPLQLSDQFGANFRGMMSELELAKTRPELKRDSPEWEEAVGLEWQRIMFASENTGHGGDMSPAIAAGRTNAAFAPFVMFTSSVSKIFSSQIRAVLAAERGDWRTAIRSGSGFIGATLWAAAMRELISYARGSDDEEERLPERIVTRMATEAAGYIPVLGPTLVGPAVRTFTGKTAPSFSANVVDDVLSETSQSINAFIRTVQTAMTKELDAKGEYEFKKQFVRSMDGAAQFLSVWTGVPYGGPKDFGRMASNMFENILKTAEPPLRDQLRALQDEVDVTQERRQLLRSIRMNDPVMFRRAAETMKEKGIDLTSTEVSATINRRYGFLTRFEPGKPDRDTLDAPLLALVDQHLEERDILREMAEMLARENADIIAGRSLRPTRPTRPVRPTRPQRETRLY